MHVSDGSCKASTMATAVTDHSVDSPSEFVIRCAGRAAADDRGASWPDCAPGVPPETLLVLGAQVKELLER